MSAKKFDYQGARNSGYTDEEIASYLSEQNPKFDFQGALSSGYTLEEINNHLGGIEEKPERSALEKGGRIASQFALGAAENALLPYELAVAPLASQEAQNIPYRQNLSDDLELLVEKKASGDWSDLDQKLLDSITEQIKDPRKSMDFVKTADLSVRGLAEKATGIDLKPEGIAEKAAHWTGFIKDPKKVFELGKTGLKPVDAIKAISPSGKEALSGLGAGTALQLAENGEFGPIGTMAAAVVGDISGRFTSGALKGAKRIISEPRKALAEVAASFTKKDKANLQKEIIKDFQDANLQADLGTITDSDLIKWVQSRLAQSGLTGKGLDELRDQLTNQIKTEYKAIADSLGASKYATKHEAGEVAREGIKKIRDADLAETRKIYKNATNELSELSVVDSRRLAKSIERIEKELKPGNIKSSEQSAVLDQLSKLKKDLYDSNGNLLYAKVKDLMNNKIALNDIINYEVQGGSKQLLKEIVSELDRAIISHGRDNAVFAKNYISANKRFSKHAKTFRNKNAVQLLNTHDPAQLINKMNSVQGIRDLKAILGNSKEGQEIFDGLRRMKLDDVIDRNLLDSTTQQVKLGTFSKLLEKGKNREVIKEILPAESFRRLERLQKNSGKLAETAQKFLNTSKSGVTLKDAGVVYKALTDFSFLMTGNPWPLLKTGATVSGARYLTKLLGDTEFLKMVEDIVIASEKNNIPLMNRLGKMLVEPVKAALNETKNQSNRD